MANESKPENSSATERTILVLHHGAELYGSDRMLLESVIALREGGLRVVVGLPTSGPLVELLEQTGARVEIIQTLVLSKAYLRPRRLPALIWAALRGSVSALRLLRSVRPDVVYVNTVTLPLWPPLARMARIPVLTHVHEGEGSSRRTIRRLLYLPHCASRTLIFNSSFSKTVFATVYPRVAARGITVYNGVAGPPQATEPRESLDGRLNVLYFGRLSPRKGPDVLVAAARILAARGLGVTLGLLGSTFDGYEWFEDELRSSVCEAQLGDSVHFYGFHNQVWEFLADADVLVVPSRYDEPFGNTAVEAILAARPVIVSDTSGLREATAGFHSATQVPPNDPAALADALAHVAADWETKKLLAIADARVAQSKFSPARYRSEILREVTGLVRAPDEPRARTGVSSKRA